MIVTQGFTPLMFSFPGYASTDAEATKAFYMGLLGWDAERFQAGDAEGTQFSMNGGAVAGMHQMAADRIAAGVQPHWNSYVSVKGVSEYVRKAVDLGAKDLGPPENVASGDMMTTIEDPQGIRVTLFELADNEPFPRALEEPGAPCWSELCTPDAAGASRFYSTLLGWRADPFEGSPMPYTVFSLPGQENGFAGLMEITPEMASCVPVMWLPYFQIDNVQTAMARITDLGGQAHGPMEIPQVGKIIYGIDNLGARFALIQPAEEYLQ